jgi:uncharacterized protein
VEQAKNKTLVLGASNKPERYSYMATQRLLNAGYEVVLIGNRETEVLGQPIIKGKPDLKDIDTVTLYLGPAAQREYYDYVMDINPRRVIFNPGTENPEFEQALKQQGIETERACTLVLLSMNSY